MNLQDRFLMAGVMGWPVMHSRSPLMHNHWFAQEKLKGVYVPLAIQPDNLEAALRSLHPLRFSGCNLTIPHKQLALKFVDEVDPIAQKMGAISCIAVQEDGRLVGSNNDAAGFIRNIKEYQPDWRANQGPIVVIGAGGGSRAVCQGLIQEGATEIRLVNRHLERAQIIKADLGGPIEAHAWSDRHDLMAGASMVVNTTSQGMVGQTPLDIDLAKLPVDALATDIVYTPLETPFLEQARLRGNRTLNGLGMLLHQGPLGWKAWFGIEPKVTPELRKLLEQSLT
ncbi:MAG: Shikimate dehydrogenase [Pseudomonadota bacterium]|jgi:shikimate dehydrogenase